MKPTSANEVYSILKGTISKFISPSLNNYFNRKADFDYENIVKAPKAEIERYITEQNDLNSTLNRVVGIYNMYRDDSSTL